LKEEFNDKIEEANQQSGSAKKAAKIAEIRVMRLA
jgi:hypothetical protein